MNKMKRGRQSNFELFRILSAFLIIMHHYAIHSTWHFEEGTINKQIFLDIVGSVGKFGVNCFLLISGYFLVKTSFKPKKIFLLWFEVFFYSVGIFLVMVFYSKEAPILDWKNLITVGMPITFNQYWFVSYYVLFYCLAPIMNILVKHMVRRQHIFILLILFVFLSIKPVIMTLNGMHSNTENGLWFLFVYLIAAYIREYPEYFSKSAKNYFLKSFVIVSVIFLLIIELDKYNLEAKNTLSKSLIFDISSPIYLVLAVFLFCGFKNWRVRTIPVINLVGSATLGVYLIHDNKFVRPYLWKELTAYKESYNDSNLVVETIIIVVSVYFMCSFIDIFRQKIFKIVHIA